MSSKSLQEAKPIIGIVGNFQRGKSTLVNCLLEGAYALTGKRLATTKKSVYYRWGTKFNAREVDRSGCSKKIAEAKFRSGSITPTRNISHYEVEVCSEILKNVSIADTPGFDNDATDTATTLESLKTLDFVFLIVDKEFQKSDTEVVTYLQANSVPFSVVYNCSLNRGAFWHPLSTVNGDIQVSIANLYKVFKERKSLSEKMKQQIKDICPILIKGSIDEGR